MVDYGKISSSPFHRRDFWQDLVETLYGGVCTLPVVEKKQGMVEKSSVYYHPVWYMLAKKGFECHVDFSQVRVSTIAGGHIKYPGRTYGTHKNVYISLFRVTIFGPICYGPP